MVFTGQSPAAEDRWARYARTAAGKNRAFVTIDAPRPGEPPSKQARLIASAASRRPSVLVVDPAVSPLVDEALVAAQAEGIPLVFLDHPVAALRGKPHVSVVACPDFSVSARALVAATLERAKALKLRDDGAALLLLNAASDRHSEARAAALQNALSGAGVRIRPAVGFDGDPRRAAHSLSTRLADDPTITMVFADEDRGTACCDHVGRELLKDRAYVFAGYLRFGSGGSTVVAGNAAAVADYDESRFIGRVVDTAIELADGAVVPPRTEVPVAVRLGREPSKPAQDLVESGSK
jgi:ABC-type sugar transport system substrate-binding protein